MTVTRKPLDYASEVVLFGPSHKGPQKIHKDHMLLPWVVVDGGINLLFSPKLRALLNKKLKKNEVQWIGDGDSTKVLPKNFPTILFSPHKDESDLELALEIIPRAQKITLYGMWGGRFDHQLANLGVIAKFCQKSPKIAIFKDGPIILGPGMWQLPYSKNFSIMLFSRGKIKLTGACLFKLPKNTDFPALSPWGISNSWITSQKNKSVVLTNTTPLLYMPSSYNKLPKLIGKK